jgi:hypothetical protein
MMGAVDQALLRLADPRARSQLLTSDALLQLATVCYDIDPATVSGPTTAAYDHVDLAVPLASDTTTTARIMRAGDAMPWDVTATSNSGRGVVPAADAVIVAQLALRAARGGGTIEQVEVDTPDVDAAFAAALAGLPASATTDEVRVALRQAAERALADPPLTEIELDAVLAGVGGDPLRIGRTTGGRDTLGLRLTMSAAPPPAATAPLVLPVVVAVLIAEPGAMPRDLLQRTAVARCAATAYPLAEPSQDAPPRLTDRCVCWLMQATEFDDDGWPGSIGGNADAQRAARLAAARTWLATAGIAIVTT